MNKSVCCRENLLGSDENGKALRKKSKAANSNLLPWNFNLLPWSEKIVLGKRRKSVLFFYFVAFR